jgi:hypothetical protein
LAIATHIAWHYSCVPEAVLDGVLGQVCGAAVLDGVFVLGQVCGAAVWD